MNILLIKLDGIGDAVLAVPALRALRQAHPQAELTLVVRPPVDELFKEANLADRIVPAAFPQESCDIRKGWRSYVLASTRNALRARKFYLGHLSSRSYDLAVNLRIDRDSYGGAFLAGMTRAGRRIAFWEKATPSKAAGNRFHDLFYTQLVKTDAARHEVENNLLLARAAGAGAGQASLRFEIGAEDRENAASKLPALQRPHTVIFGIGATQRKRQWPLACYRNLLRRFTGSGFECVLVGSQDDGLEAAELGALSGVRNFCGRMGLREVYGLMEGCRLFVGNDSGPMHLAAAAGVPVVEISSYARSASKFGSNCPLRFGPFGVPHRVLQPERPLAPCEGQCRSAESHCIKQVRVEDVWNAASDLIRETASGGQ